MVHPDDEPSSDRAERQGVTKCDAGSKATAMRRFIIHVMASVRTVDMPLGRVGLMAWMGGAIELGSFRSLGVAGSGSSSDH